jgi:hypothetical protein
MRNRPDAAIESTAAIDPVELAAILDEVNCAIRAVDVGAGVVRTPPSVDVDTGEHLPLRDISLDRRGTS